MRAPALYALLFFATGILLASYVAIPSLLCLGITAFAAALAVVFFLANRVAHARIAICAALLIAGAFRTELSTSEFPSNHVVFFTSIDEPMTVVGEVVSEPDVRPAKTFLTVAVDSLTYKGRQIKSAGKIRLKIKEPTHAFNFRDRIRFKSYLNRPYAGRNPGAFDYRRYLEVREIYGIVNLPTAVRVTLVSSGSQEPFVRRVITPTREYISHNYERYLSTEHAAVMKGFLIGDVRFIPRKVYERFKDTGTLHVLAVSGANVAYVILAIFAFLRIARLPKKYRNIVAMVAIVLFSFLAYNQPSVVRAAIMGITLLLGRVLRRDVTPVNVIAFSALLILAFRPLCLFDLGFQLSYAAALGLILVMPQINSLLPEIRGPIGWLARRGGELFCGTLVAQLAVTPILIYYFHQVPLVSFISNMVVVPLVGIATVLGILLAFVGEISAVATLIAWPLTWTLDGILSSIDFFHTLGVPMLHSGTPHLTVILIYYAAALVIFTSLVRWRSAILFVLLLVVGMNLFVWKEIFAGTPPELQITILDTSDVSTTVIREQDGQTTLINGGGMWRHFDRGQSVVLPFLRAGGIGHIDRLLATDTTQANYQSMISVLSGLDDLRIADTVGNELWRKYRSQIDTVGPVVTFLNYGLVILNGHVSARNLNNLPDSISLLAADWSYLDSGILTEFIRSHNVEALVFTNYPNRYCSRDLLERFCLSNPAIDVSSVLESGGITVEYRNGIVRVLAEPNR